MSYQHTQRRKTVKRFKEKFGGEWYSKIGVFEEMFRRAEETLDAQCEIVKAKIGKGAKKAMYGNNEVWPEDI